MPRLSKIGAAALAAFGWTGLQTVSATYLVVAGGGAGGFNGNGGGGGAGGFLTGTTSLNPTLSYTVTVGAGGTSVAAVSSTNGSNSTFNAITAIGGGAGGPTASGVGAGNSGGSGGGGLNDSTNYAGGSGTSGQGNSGGASGGGGAPYPGGGGGGASAAGTVGTSGGQGGAGTASSISGSSVTYAGGGGGARSSGGASAGGAGGGGNGGVASVGIAGTANTGGGGGGTGVGGVGGGQGGSGIVIISYAGAQQFGGGVVTSSGGNTIHTFTTSGTLSPITPLTASSLVVAGGGGGGADSTYGGGGWKGGGGGAGGYRTASGLTIDTNSIYLVTVGAGGAGGASAGANGAAGGDSSFSSTTSTGGGYGAGSAGTSTTAGGSGGSGGGASGGFSGSSSGGTGNTPSTSPSQGNNGGSSGYAVAGGGGGSTAAGSNSVASGGGGTGTANSISGASVTYATGGAVAGGVVGTTNTGNGGSGGSGNGAVGYAGGSGIVIISYPGSTQQMAGGTVTITGGNVIHTFTSSGYLTPIKYVSNSLRFRSSASAYLNRTPTATGNRRTWTVSCWVKRGRLATGTEQVIFSSNNGSTYTELNYLASSDVLRLNLSAGGSAYYFDTSAVFRDPAAWYHIVVAVDTTQATSTDRMKVYINGVQQTGSNNAPSLNYDTDWNRAQAAYIGARTSGTWFFDGYLAEINSIDGQALTPNSFGTFNSYGVWQPITYGGSYGTNGFYLPFTNNTSTTTLGYDFSPNGNNWTTNNISLTAGATYDSMTDVPTLTSATAANYCTLNPLDKLLSPTFVDGNLGATVGDNAEVRGTIYVSSGKWYWEVVPTTMTFSFVGIGIGGATKHWATTGISYYGANGNKYVNGTASAYGASYTNNDVIGVALDLDNLQITFYKNNTSQGTITGLTAGSYALALSAAGNSSVYATNFGQRPFTYTPPSGFVALNTYNL